MSFYDAIRVGAAGAADTFQIERSVRISRDRSTYFTVNNSSSGNTQTFTFSFWMKLGKVYNGFLPIYSQYLTGSNRCGITLTSGTASAGIQYQNRQSGSHKALIDPAEKLRDHSAWYHVVIRMDTTNSTQADRFIIYVNGRRIAISGTLPVQNSTSKLNSDTTHYIGHDGFSGTGDFYLADIHLIDGQALDASYFAETDATTGQWMPKEYTGSYSGTSYHLKFDDNSGTTATTLGKDSSGLGNNVTPNNFSTQDSVPDSPTNNFCTGNPIGRTYTDAVGNNPTYSEGNLEFETAGNSTHAYGTMAVNEFLTSGCYFEILLDDLDTSRSYVGIVDSQSSGNDASYGFVNKAIIRHSMVVYFGTAIDGTGNYDSGVADCSSGDIIGVAIKGTSIWFHKNGTYIPNSSGSTGNPSTGANAAITSISNITTTKYLPYAGYNSDYTFNFGQDSSFAGAKTAQGNVDGKGKGDFYYPVPTGFVALCSANMSDPTIKLPNKHFDTTIYTGNETARSFSLDFGADWIWIKERSAGGSHRLFDSVRGANNLLISSQNTEELVRNDEVPSFISTGFNIGDSATVNENSVTNVAWTWNAGDTDSATYTVKVVSDGGNKYRFNNFGTSAVTLDLAEGGTYTFDGSDSSMSGHPFVIGTAANGTVYSTGVTYQLDGASVTYSAYTSGYASASTRKLIITVPASAPVLYYWCSIHSGMGGQINTNSTLGSSNFDGTIQSTAKVNATAGFSIITYTGNGSNSTVGHGLGVKPDTIIVKGRNIAGQDWVLYNKNLDGGNQPATHIIKLNTTAAEADVNDVWNDTEPTSTVFSVGVEAMVNYNTSTNYVAYCFSEVVGYSKFGSYTGNGSSDGTFVFTGFRPALIIIKRTDSSSGANWLLLDDKRNTFNVVNKNLFGNLNNAEADTDRCDFLSNGFKLRQSGTTVNTSSGTYIYFAFAESPFKNSRAR